MFFRKTSEAKVENLLNAFAHNYFMNPGVMTVTVKWCDQSKELFGLYFTDFQFDILIGMYGMYVYFKRQY